jgi:hypothetical protein
METILITLVIGASLGFVVGILVGRKNVKAVNATVNAANTIATATTSAVNDLKKG